MENETSVAEVGSVKINLPHQIEDVVIKEQLRKISDLRIDEIVNISADQFEKNIKDMLSSIKELDYSLKCSLDLSQTLKKEAQENDEKIKGLMEENQKLNKRILARSFFNLVCCRPLHKSGLATILDPLPWLGRAGTNFAL